MKISTLSFFICIQALLAFAGCQCNKVKMPEADRTAPSCSWEIHEVESDKKIEFPNGGTYHVGRMYKVRVYFKVVDNDGGVKSISVNGNGTKAYPERTTYVNWGPQNQLSWNENYTYTPDAQNMVQKSSTLFKEFDFTPVKTDSTGGGLSLQVITPAGGSLVLTGTGENYYGGKCSSTLRITATPVVSL
jgi:hypothetical protein